MRYLLIDRLIELVPHEHAVSTKVFTGEEDFFRDHFPGFPVVPGALLTEAMSQTAGWLIAASVGFTRWPLLSMVHAAKFRRFAAPGDTLRVEARIESMQTHVCTARAGVTRADTRIADASLSFQMFVPETLGEGHSSFATWSRETFDDLGGAALLERGRP